MQIHKVFAFLLPLVFLGSSIALAQHDERKDPRKGHPVNRVVEKHPKLFRNSVPPPHHNHSHAKPHSKHRVWVPPHRDKHHRYVRGYWIRR